MKSNKLKREPKYIAKFKAFPYQQEAVDAVKDLEYAAIFHEQGLGKTKIAIDVLLYWLSECSMDTALIVTKKQLVANWVNEFKDHTSIKPAVLNTDKNNNYRIFCGPYRVVLTNFETLETEKQQFELYLKVRNVGIIIDESAKLKNPNSKLTKTYFELAPLFQRRIIMTGTPVANRPYDIWAQIYFLDFGESLGADFNEFKKETDLSNKLSRNTDLQEEFEDNISQIFNRISSFTVRETKNSGIITLPDKVYIQEVTEFNRMQEELYERIRTELYAEVVRDGERYIDDCGIGMSWIARWKCHDTDRLLALEIFLQYHLYAVVFAHGSCRIYWNRILPVSVYACVSKDAYSSCCGYNTFCNPVFTTVCIKFRFLIGNIGCVPRPLATDQ